MARTRVAHDVEPLPVPVTAASRRRPSMASTRSMGILVAIVSCAAFATSGPFAKSLLAAGWSPVTAVAARISIATVALTIPTILSLRGRFSLLLHNWRAIVLYGLFGVAGSQLCYFNAVTHVSVGVALLVEYLAPMLLVGYAWARFGRRPRALTALGTLAALAGLLFVLDVFAGLTIDLTGLAWAGGAAVCLAVYFVIAGDEESDLPAMALAGAGMGVGGVILLGLCAFDALPVRLSTADAPFMGGQVPFWVPLLGLGLVAAAFAYVTGIMAARSLGTTVASFISLLEVLFAVLFAWLFIGEVPTTIQLVGGFFIIVGVLLVRLDESRAPAPQITPTTAPPADTPQSTGATEAPGEIAADVEAWLARREDEIALH